VSGLASSHPDDTWGTVEGVGMNKTDRTGERGIFAGSFLKPNFKYTKKYDFLIFSYFPSRPCVFKALLVMAQHSQCGNMQYFFPVQMFIVVRCATASQSKCK